MARSWQLEPCIKQLIEAEENRVALKCWNLNEHEFKNLIEMKVFLSNPEFHDRQGRPLIFLISRNFNMGNTSIEHLVRFTAWSMDQACANMPPETD